MKKQKQTYLYEIIKRNPGINSGRKNYSIQYTRVLKNILMSHVYDKLITINNFNTFKNIKFEENNKYIIIKFNSK